MTSGSRTASTPPAPSSASRPASRSRRTSPGEPHLGPGEEAVRAALRRRGLAWNGERDPTPLLVPRLRDARERHATLLRHYSYRLFLRDVLKHRTALRLGHLTRYASRAVAARYLRFLVDAGLVARVSRGRYRLREARLHPFGGTLAGYVAATLDREFGVAATPGLRIPDPAHRGPL